MDEYTYDLIRFDAEKYRPIRFAYLIAYYVRCNDNDGSHR